MTNHEYNAKAEKHGEIIADQKKIRRKAEGLAWKQSQPNCWSEERQARIDAIVGKYHELSRKAADVWSNLS